jgi:iron complex transport system ATP-binding protein
VILVTHHVEEIIPEIDRVILIKDGKIFRDGAKKDILTGDILSELFDEQIQLRENNGYYSAEVELLSSDRISDPD